MEGLCSAPCLVSSVTTTLTTANRGVTCKRDAKNPTLMAGHGFRRHKGLGLFDCGPLGGTCLDIRAGVRPRFSFQCLENSLRRI